MSYRLWVNDERTTFVRLWDTGTVEVARRESPAHTWGPPEFLTEEHFKQAATTDGEEAQPTIGTVA